MAFTGRLGTDDSYLGNIVLGIDSLAEAIEVSLSDGLTSLTDNVTVLKTYLVTLSDDTDNYVTDARIVLGKHFNFNDNIQALTDAISTTFFGVVKLNLSDILNAFLDHLDIDKKNTTSPQLIFKPFFHIYLRRYLNDVVVRDDNEVLNETEQIIYKPFFHVYLRRYLNDVVSKEANG